MLNFERRKENRFIDYSRRDYEPEETMNINKFLEEIKKRERHRSKSMHLKKKKGRS